MRRMALRQASLCSLLLSFTLAPQLRRRSGQGETETADGSGPVGSGGADSSQQPQVSQTSAPRWPGSRGRRRRHAGRPQLVLRRPAAGGVWKTIDGGDSWEAVFKDQPTASIGAIALAPSNPNVVWVGTGEGKPADDVVDGARRVHVTDAVRPGSSWASVTWGNHTDRDRSHETRTSCWWPPLGHVWGPNPGAVCSAPRTAARPGRGLFVNDTTGATD